MNKITVIKEIYPYYKESKGLVILKREFNLPIQPFARLTLIEDNWCVELRNVIYDVKKMEWVCPTEPDRGWLEPSEEAVALGVAPDMDSIIAGYLTRGWQKV